MSHSILRTNPVVLKKTSLFSFLFLLAVSAVFGQDDQNQKKKVKHHSVYVTSNTGIRSDEANRELLSTIVEASKKEDSSSLVIVGNLVPKKGYPNKDKGRDEVKKYLKANLLDHINDFKGNIIFTPGPNEWKRMPQIISMTWSLFFRIILEQNSGLTMAVL